MVDKKGYIRTIEAVLAVLIIFGVLVFINTRNVQQEIDVPGIVESSQKIILETLFNDLALRYCIVEGIDSTTTQSFIGKCTDANFVINDAEIPLTADRTRLVYNDHPTNSIVDCGNSIKDFITENLPPGYLYTCEICDKTLSCLPDDETILIPINKNVYTKTVFMALTEERINQKVVRLYFWKSS